MATKVELIEFICEQIAPSGEASYKKMFGEYMVYLNGKPVLTICNDVVYVKISETSAAIMGESAKIGEPYHGAKPHFIVDNLDDAAFMQRLATAVEAVTPLPKPKKKKPIV